MTTRFLPVAAAMAGLWMSGAVAQATVLTFDIGGLSSGNAIPATYGDRVISAVDGTASYGTTHGFTPNIVADITATGGANFWSNDYGDLTNVVYDEAEGDNLLRIRLTADTGFLVELFGFDLAGWPSTDYTISSVSVVDGGGNALFAQSSVLVRGASTGPAGRRTTFSFPTPLTAPVVEIRIVPGIGGGSDNIGLDNLAFGQAIPEPTALATLAPAALLLTRRRRR